MPRYLHFASLFTHRLGNAFRHGRIVVNDELTFRHDNRSLAGKRRCFIELADAHNSHRYVSVSRLPRAVHVGKAVVAAHRLPGKTSNSVYVNLRTAIDELVPHLAIVRRPQKRLHVRIALVDVALPALHHAFMGRAVVTDAITEA